MRLRLPVVLATAVFALTFAATSFAQLGPPGGTIYAHDETYRTVATPADLPAHGDFNTIYVLDAGLAPVSDSAPGDRTWRGGRWEVRLVGFTTIAPRQFTNAEDLRAAAARGEVSIGEIVRRFECPLIKARR